MEECQSFDFRGGAFYGSNPSQIYDRSGIMLRDGRDSSLPTTVLISPPFAMAPSRSANGPSKRKYEHIVNYQPSYVENCLVQLCRAERWMEVVHRCHYYPEEACLIPIRDENTRNDNVFRRHSSKESRENDPTPLFRETALGIVCSSKFTRMEEAKQAILALVHTNPRQVGANQCIPGHTPLRAAVLNGCCTVEIFRILAEATSAFKGGDRALYQKDSNGHTPIDHLVASVQLGSSLDSIAMLKEFLRVKQNVCITASLEHSTSPLIRLLTMGNASNSSASPMKARKFSWEFQPKDSDNHAFRLKRVLEATKLLLDDDPGLIRICSKLTKCTPLHAALRNYGNFAPLIEELMRRDQTNSMVQMRNSYGDLPIHVACSVGVPFHVLSLVIENTVSAANCEENSLVWSSNKFGYTPVDLEWIGHIESGEGLYMARPFSPTEVKQHCFKQDSYYRDLLKDSVDQVIDQYDSASKEKKSECGTESRKDEAQAVFGCLMDRLSLIISAASTTAKSKYGANSIRSMKLVELCKLSTPYYLSLPLPILELFLWLHPEQVLKKGPQGYLPIHQALRYKPTKFCHEVSSTTPLSSCAIDDWKSFVFQLLNKDSEQCRVKSREGRLPLHYALDHSAASKTTTSTMRKALQSSRHAIIEKLVDLYPAAVDQKDPVTGLYPFMMASTDKTISLNTIFCLLRRSPSRCLPVARAAENNTSLFITP